MADEGLQVQIERLIGKLDRLEQDALRRDARAMAQGRELETTRRRLEEEARESDQLRQQVEAFGLLVDDMASAQRQRIADAAATARLTGMLARWLQLGVGALVLVVTSWTGGVRATLDYLGQLLRDLK